MAISNPRLRNAETALVHRQKTIRPTANGQYPVHPDNAPQGKQFVEGSINAAPKINNGKTNKYTAKSPLMTSMSKD